MRAKCGLDLKTGWLLTVCVIALFAARSPTATAQDATNQNKAAKHELAGRVLLPDGQAASKASVHLRTRHDARQTIRSTTANENGEFYFDDLKDGTHRLVATAY